MNTLHDQFEAFIDTNTASLNKKRLTNQIELTESLIQVYSGRDRIRTVQLESELFNLNMKLLDLMTSDTNL